MLDAARAGRCDAGRSVCGGELRSIFWPREHGFDQAWRCSISGRGLGRGRQGESAVRTGDQRAVA